jgi:peroxiredoxin
MPQKKQLYFLVILISFFSCVSILTPNDIITKSLETIEEIDYIEYSSITTLSAHRDTSNFYRTIKSSWKVKINPDDSVIGAQYYQIYDDSSVGKGSECYDGDYRVLNTFNNELSTIIDSNLNPEKIKSLIAPFHIRAKAILEYALKDDSCQINVLAESKREITVKIEFIRKNILSFSMKVEHGRGDGGNSVYEITFNKDTNLPTRLIYKSSYQVIEWGIGNIKVNPSERENIIAMNTIPNGYRITDNPQTSNDIDLTGTQAPDFKLVNSNGVSIKLSDYQGKTILLEFTSMGCAPCQLAIPDLIKLKNEYSDLPFELISIESWVDRFSPDALKKHAIEKGINYEATYGSRAISEKFHVYGVPTFFIIDKNGIIKKRFVGYTKDSTKMELGNILKELL